jgi:hypothetical protein
MRYQPIPIIVSDDNEIIPIWDKRLIFIKSDYYGDYFEIKDNLSSRHFHPQEGIFDTKTKTVSGGIIVEFKNMDGAKRVGEEIYYEPRGYGKKIKKSKIKEILFENYKPEINKGKKLQSLQKQIVDFDPQKLYLIKNYEREYLLENGDRTIDLYIKEVEE